MSYPVEPKVQVAGVTAAVSGAVLWVLGKYVFQAANARTPGVAT